MLSAHAQFARRVRGDGWHSLLGTPLYYTGTLGVVQIPSGAVVLQISVQSTSGGSFTLFGGAPIPIPASIYPLEFVFQHTLWQSNPQNIGLIVFTGTTHFFVNAVQEGHAPVASVPFLPPQVGNLLIWQRADMGITLSGSNVSGWADQSGNGYNLTQGTPARRPVYNSTDAAYGSQATIQCAASAVQYMVNSGAPSSAQPFTTIIVGESTSGAGQQQFFGDGGTNTTGPFWTGSAWAYYAGVASVVSSNVSRAPHVFAVVFNGASSALYIDGSQTAIANGSAGANGFGSAPPLIVGSDGVAEHLNGKIAEFLVYSAALTPSQRKSIFTYLGARYGIAVS